MTPSDEALRLTPRTDGAERQIACFSDHPAVLCLLDLSRTLERELNALSAQAETLRGEVDRYKALWLEATDEIVAQGKARQSAEAQLAQARKDSERLEWMQRHNAHTEGNAGCTLFRVIWWNNYGEHFTDYFKDWREAIDAALKGTR